MAVFGPLICYTRPAAACSLVQATPGHFPEAISLTLSPCLVRAPASSSLLPSAGSQAIRYCRSMRLQGSVNAASQQAPKRLRVQLLAASVVGAV